MIEGSKTFNPKNTVCSFSAIPSSLVKDISYPSEEMKYNKVYNAFLWFLTIFCVIFSFLYYPFPDHWRLIISIFLVMIASMARLNLPKSRFAVIIRNPAVLCSVWLIGPFSIIPAVLPEITKFFLKKDNEFYDYRIDSIDITGAIIISSSTAFLYAILGGQFFFNVLSYGMLVPIFASIAFFTLLNLFRIGSLSNEENMKLRLDISGMLIDLAFMPVSILIVIIYSNWNFLNIVFIVSPLAILYAFLKKAFRNYEEKDDLNIFYRFTNLISSSLNLDQVLSSIIDELMEVSQMNGCILALLDTSGKEVVSLASKGVLSGFSLNNKQELIERIISELRSEGGRGAISIDDSILTEQEKASITGFQMSVTPMKEEEKSIGFILSIKGSFSAKDYQYLAIIASQATSVILNAGLYRKAIKANDDLKEAQTQLIQSSKMAAVGQLAAGVAHELNNPLGAILTNLQTLNPYLEENEYLIECLKKAEEAVIECKSIIEKLLNYSRQAEMGDQKVNIKSVVMDTLLLIEEQLKHEDIEIAVLFEEDIHVIMANPSLLSQVVTNIVINSFDAILEAKKEKGLITIKGFRKDSFTGFVIEDNGKGMDEKIKEKIFNPFFTTKEIENASGLGLTISREIVSKYGGSIDVETKLNEGTIVTVKLPVYVENNQGGKS